ncbi:MAG: PilN domain-containing protein [Gammaproteobacteria bacterium]|nr:PilN domain-containing protein [Gammaproteobacteria bacterium]
MARINLLPWREELRKQRKQEFGVAILASLAIAGLLWGLVYFHFDQRIDYQNARNKYLEDQIALLDTKIKEIQELEKEKQRLLARMRAIETLQTSRPVIVHLFDEIVRALPDGVYLTDITQQDDVVTFKGVARSNARVSNFMRNVEESEWVTEPKLTVIETREEKGLRLSDFTLVVKQKQRKPEEDGGGAGGGST